LRGGGGSANPETDALNEDSSGWCRRGLRPACALREAQKLSLSRESRSAFASGRPSPRSCLSVHVAATLLTQLRLPPLAAAHRQSYEENDERECNRDDDHHDASSSGPRSRRAEVDAGSCFHAKAEVRLRSGNGPARPLPPRNAGYQQITGMTQEALSIELPVRPESARRAREAVTEFRGQLKSQPITICAWW
jgi:hypothetical protein